MNFHERLRALAALIAVATVGCVLAAAVLAAPASAASLLHFRSAVGRAERAIAPGPSLPAASAQFRNPIDVPGAAATFVIGVNNSGMLVGAWQDLTGDLFGFIEFPRGQPISFDYPGTGFTAPQAINDLGTVVGFYLDSNGVPHGWIRSLGGNFTPLDDPSALGAGTFVYGINDRGVIVGAYFDASGAEHGFIDDRGTFTTLDYPGASSTGASNVNNSGAIVGGYSDASGVSHGFLYEHGTFTTIDAPAAGTASGEGTVAQSISSNGVIDGYITNGPSNSPSLFGWLLRGGEFSQLNDPNAVPGTSFLDGLSSNARYAAGSYTDTNGATHGYVATLSP
jgi:probable HAF family extracellular repeat protein